MAFSTAQLFICVFILDSTTLIDPSVLRKATDVWNDPKLRSAKLSKNVLKLVKDFDDWITSKGTEVIEFVQDVRQNYYSGSWAVSRDVDSFKRLLAKILGLLY
jgi:hypothetical protein